MLNNRIKEIWSAVWQFLRHMVAKIRLPSWNTWLGWFTSWWRVVAIALGLIVFFYYPLGGALINKIDTDTNIEIREINRSQSATAEMMAYMIDREVNDKIWTPNLPFFFPSYVLDNMPSFQLGMFSTLASFSKPFAARMESRINDGSEKHLSEAASLLKYPGTIWMFSPQNKLKPVPSAHSQYRKARKQLIHYNQQLAEGSEVFYRHPGDLALFLSTISGKLGATASKLAGHIREESPAYFDSKADDVFYYAQGRLYADYLLLKALEFDYRDIIVEANLYAEWTKLLKMLENAVTINPLLVRNGELNSSFAPNHLSGLGFYTLRAQLLMNKIIQSLNQKYNQNKD